MQYYKFFELNIAGDTSWADTLNSLNKRTYKSTMLWVHLSQRPEFG